MNLQETDLFSDLEETKANLIVSKFRKTSFQKNDIIFHEGDNADKFFILADGEIALLKTTGTSQKELRRLLPGELFGEMALISDSKRSVTTKVLRDSECLVMDRQTFINCMENDLNFALRMQRALAKRLADTDEGSHDEILNHQRSLIFSLAKLAESRDPDTSSHLNRIRHYCAILAEHLAERPEFKKEITPEFIENIYTVSPLHDIGKVGIPDKILFKAGKLTYEEFDIIKNHSRLGAESLQFALQFSSEHLFQMAYNITLWHHECHDAQGYPDALYGDQIPLEARIMAIVDVYDALVTRRIYKPPYGRDETYWAIQHLSGKKFDPLIAEVMLGCTNDFEKIYQQYP